MSYEAHDLIVSVVDTRFNQETLTSWEATRAAKCFGSCVEDIVFRRHPVGGDEGFRTRDEARLGSPNLSVNPVNPATNAAGERSFSSSRPLKTWLRSRMDDESISSVCFPCSRSLGRKAGERERKKLEGGLGKAPSQDTPRFSFVRACPPFALLSGAWNRL